MKTVLVLAMFGVGAVGCTKEKTEKLTEPSSLFKGDDLAAGAQVAPLTSDEVQVEVDNNESLGASGTLGGTALSLAAEDTQAACTTAKIRALKVNADKVNLTVRGTVDLTSCIGALGDSMTTVTAASMKVLLYFGCLDDDLSGFDGLTVGDLLDRHIECTASETTKRMAGIDINFATKSTYTVDTDTFEIVEDFRIVNAVQTALGGTCSAAVSAAVVRWKNDCLAVDRFLITKQEINGQKGHDQGTEKFLQLTYKDLEESVTEAPWYEGGGFDVRMGNWSGSVAYTGASSPPSFTLTDGTNTLAGVVGRGSTVSTNLTELPIAGTRFARALHEIAARGMPKN